MTERYELKLCSNGTYYVYENGTLTDIDFDKFNKESADGLIDELNTLYDENEQLKESLENKMESDAYWEQKAKERVNKLEKENEELKKDLEILVHLVDWRDKLEKEWWRCEYFTNPLGVAFCRKNEDFCKRGECEEIYNKIGENE